MLTLGRCDRHTILRTVFVEDITDEALYNQIVLKPDSIDCLVTICKPESEDASSSDIPYLVCFPGQPLRTRALTGICFEACTTVEMTGVPLRRLLSNSCREYCAGRPTEYPKMRDLSLAGLLSEIGTGHYFPCQKDAQSGPAHFLCQCSAGLLLQCHPSGQGHQRRGVGVGRRMWYLTQYAVPI